MINNQKEGATPIVDENEDVIFFETMEEAKEVAKNHLACQAFGYEIFELGMGEM